MKTTVLNKNLNEKLEIVLPLIEKGLIYTILYQISNEDDMKYYLELLGMKEEYARIVVVELGCEESPVESKMGNARTFYQDFRMIVKGFFPAAIGPVLSNRVVLFIPCEKKDVREDISEKVTTMIKILSDRTGFMFRAGIGSVHSNFNIYMSYQKALVALEKNREEFSDKVKRARQYIDQNFTADISLDDVSRQINISPFYFSKVFKDETGETFVEYLTGLRIKKAKQLLKEREYSIKQICMESGYRNPNYFSRIFKKNVGVTPSEYRESK